jgi:hypothetical protein
MDIKSALQKRLQDLDISQYELTRRVVEQRNAKNTQDEDTTVQKLQSAVYKALKEPDGRRYSAIAEIVEAMGGEIVIRWTNVEEVKVAS